MLYTPLHASIKKCTIGLLILLGGLSGCQLQNQKDINHTLLAVDPDISSSKLPMSALYADLKYVKLETTPQSLIAQVSKIIPLKERLAIVDKESARILLFEKNGRFVASIGKKGNGPDEFTGIEDVTIDEANNRIYVLDSSGQQLLVFNLQNEYLGRKKTDFITHEIELVNSNLLACYCDYAANANYEKKDMRPNLFLLDLDKMEETPLLYTPSSISVQEVNSPFSALSSYDKDRAFLFDILTNSVYIINAEGVAKSYDCNFGDKEEALKHGYIAKLQSEQLGAEQIMPGVSDAPAYTVITSCVGCADYLLLTAVNYSNGNIFQVAYSPDTEKCLYAKANRGYPLENDIDGIIPFATYASDSQTIYGVIESYQLAEDDDKVSELIGDIKEDDNPVIVMAKTKQLK